jgi:hypothetical protein
LICSFNFLIFLAVCLNISTVINIKILANSSQQTQSYKFTSQIAAFLSVVLISEMLEICIQTSYEQNVQLNLKSYLPEVYGTPLRGHCWSCLLLIVQVHTTTHCMFYREQLGPHLLKSVLATIAWQLALHLPVPSVPSTIKLYMYIWFPLDVVMSQWLVTTFKLKRWKFKPGHNNSRLYQDFSTPY